MERLTNTAWRIFARGVAGSLNGLMIPKRRTTMRNCDKFCIANVGGKCAVQDCRGPVERIGQRPDFDLELAAKAYKISMDSFDDFFGGKDHA